MVMVVMRSAATALLLILLNLSKCLLRPGEIPGLQILAQRLEFLRKLRLTRLRAAGGRGRGRGARRCRRRCCARRSRKRGLRILRQSHEVLLGCREVTALQVAAKLLKFRDKLACTAHG